MTRYIATVGTFDGLHGGHLHLLDTLQKEGRRRGLATMAVTFTGHPLATVAPERVPPLLQSRHDVIRLIERAGVDRVVFLDFTLELAAYTASAFMRFLHQQYAVDILLMGYDNTLGADRLVARSQYVEAGREAGVEVVFADAYINPLTGHTPASSLLRKLLADGDVETFALNAGRQYHLEGIVEHGRRNGHRLGFPTLNLRPQAGICVPATGVYAGTVEASGNIHPAVINIGCNPTIANDNPVTIEAHAIDVNLGELYGRQVAVTFLRRLRGERRFGSLEELKSAIAADIAAANSTFTAPI